MLAAFSNSLRAGQWQNRPCCHCFIFLTRSSWIYLYSLIICLDSDEEDSVADLEEEIMEQDGEYEEYLAYDFPVM